VLVNHDRVVQVVVLKLVLDGIVLRRGSLRLAQLRLGELDGIVFERLQIRVVQVVEAVVREFIHGRCCVQCQA
jgi:hypothetical protein